MSRASVVTRAFFLCESLMKHVQNFENFDDSIDLSCSIVTYISIHADALTVGLEVFLDPGHVHHRAPKPPEIACYRPATLVFPALKRVLSRETRINIYSAQDKRPDMGELHSVKFDGSEYVLSADFGQLRIIADAPKLEIEVED